MKIFASMAKTGARLQEHQILLQMSIRLKEIANKHKVFLTTSTQLNGNHKEGEMDDSSLSGAKAIAQKVDVGALLLEVNSKDEEIINTVMQNGSVTSFGLRPNLSLNFYKNRGNRWKLCRLWLNFDHSTLRVKDCFVTDYKGTLIPNLKPLKVVFEEDEEEEVDIIFPEGHDSLPESFDF